MRPNKKQGQRIRGSIGRRLIVGGSTQRSQTLLSCTFCCLPADTDMGLAHGSFDKTTKRCSEMKSSHRGRGSLQGFRCELF